MDSVLTVAIVVKNDQFGLNKTKHSLELQNTKEFDIVIIDGASKDGTLPYIKNWNSLNHDLPISQWISEPDSGIYDAMNKAAKLAKTDYIIYINAGDTLYRRDSLKHLIDAIRDNKDADFVCGGYCFVTEEGVEKVAHLGQDPRIGWNMIERGQFNNRYMHGVPLHNSTAIRRQVLLEYPYNWKRFKISADIEQMLRAWRGGYRNWAITPTVICSFQQGGISTQRRMRVLKEMVELFEDASFNKDSCRNYLKSALRQEVEAQIKTAYRLKKPFKWIWRDLLPLLKTWPLSTVKSLIDVLYKRNKTTIGLNRKQIVYIINLSRSVDVFRDSLHQIRDLYPNHKIVVGASTNTMACVQATRDDKPIMNIDCGPNLSRCNVILVLDDTNLSPAILHQLYNMGVHKPIIYVNNTLEKAKIKKQQVVGVDGFGNCVYKIL